MNLRIITLYLCLGFLWLSPLHGAIIENGEENKPVLYYADSQTYDRELGILILKGHVEFDHEGSILEADYVTYNENTDVVTASGNVRLRQAQGDVTFGEYLELTGDMKEGIVLQIRALLQDDSKIAAIEGRKFEERQELDQAVYTPCELCGDKLPTWQINARRAIKDDLEKNIYFSDAEMRILDVPVLYFPYATQPLERRTGFLIPQIDYSSDFGGILRTPYFIALSEDKDITLTPMFFTNQRPLIYGEYNQAFGNGYFSVEGSITRYRRSVREKKAAEKGKFDIPKRRGFFYADTQFNLNDVWRLKGSGGLVTDKTFFKKYQWSDWQRELSLPSKGLLEGFLNQRDYAAAKVYYFQTLQNNVRQERVSSPLPLMEYSSYSGVDSWGGRFKFDGNLLNLYRKEGINMQRGIGIAEWQRPWIIPYGQVFTVFGSTRGDLYKIENTHKDFKHRHHRHRDKKEGGARFFPQAGLNWHWPFFNSIWNQSFVLQPMAQLIAAPQEAIGVKAHDIPDEDSTDFEFNDANLFSADRFPGYDRIDTGSRFVYGGEIFSTGGLFGDVELFLGQSYNFTDPLHHVKNQGLSHRSSDYVGRIQASPFVWLTLNYRFRLDQNTWSERVSELGGTIGPDIAKVSAMYVFVSKDAGTPNHKDFRQINLNFSSQFTEHWTFLAHMIKDLRKDRVFEKSIGIQYRDNCFGLGFSIMRKNYKDRDLRPDTIFLGTLFLKNLGQYNWSFNQDGLFGRKSSKEEAP